jgi:hypothetical protein
MLEVYFVENILQNQQEITLVEQTTLFQPIDLQNHILESD